MSLNLPEPTEPLKQPSYRKVTWQEWMDETAQRTRDYLKNHYDPEERLANKVSERFVWDLDDLPKEKQEDA